VIVHLSGLHIVAGPKHRDSASDAEERDRLERTKKRRLQLADLLGLDAPEEEVDEAEKIKRRRKAEEENDSVFGKLKMKILNNIQVKVENIHIRYQDDLSNPQNPFALGITLDELYAESADENWKPGWIKSSKSTIIRKLARLQNLCIYFDTAAKPKTSGTTATTATTPNLAPATPTPASGAPASISGPVSPMLKLPQGLPATATTSPLESFATQKGGIIGSTVAQVASHDPNKVKDRTDIIFKFSSDQQMCKVLTEMTYKKSHAHQPPHNYVLAPFSAQVKLTLDISEDMAQFTRPKVQVDASVQDIQLALNQAQFFGALDLFQYFSLYINSLKYLALRPAQLNDKTLQLPENRSKLARLRWSYVLACVRSDVRKKVDSWSWSNIVQRKKDRATYTELFKKLKLGDKKLKTAEEEQLTVLEKVLEYDDIIVYRKLAYASIQRDKRRKKRKKLEEKESKSSSRTSTPAASSAGTLASSSSSLNSSGKKEKEKEKKEEGSIIDRLFGLTKSDKEKARDKEREKEKKEAERLEKERLEKEKKERDKAKLAPSTPGTKAGPLTPAASPSPAPTSSTTTPTRPVNLDDVDEAELLKELYSSIDFDATAVHEHSDYPKDYIHTKLAFLINKGAVQLLDVDPALPAIANFSFSNIYTGIRLSGVSSLQLDGYVESCQMLEYHTLGSIYKPFPVIQRDEMGADGYSGTTSEQHIFAFTVGTNGVPPGSMTNEVVDLDLSIMALPLLITISRPFIDRLVCFFDLYGRDDISEHLSQLTQQTLDSIKQRAEAQVKYALGARKTVLVNACVHAPRIQVPSDYRDPYSSLFLLDLGIISVLADTTRRPDSKAALAKVQQWRENQKQLSSSGNEIKLVPIDDSYFYDQINLKLTGLTAGIVPKRSTGEARRPPPKNSSDIITIIGKIDTIIQLGICNTPTPDLPRARLDGTVSEVVVKASKEKMSAIFDVVKTALKDTRPKDPIREAEMAEKARLRRLQLILWNEELGDDAPALHALLHGMDAVNRRRQNLAAFLDFEDSETETDFTDTEISDSMSETDSADLDSSSSKLSSHGSSSSLAQVKDRLLRAHKARPSKQKYELKLFEGKFVLDGIKVVLGETLDKVEYSILTLQLEKIVAQLNISDQSIILQNSLYSFAIQEHITERTSFGASTGNEHYMIRSVAPPDMALIQIRYEQLDRKCTRYANIDHNVKMTMQGLEVTVSRLTIASLIVVATELATSLQQAMGITPAQSSVVSLAGVTSQKQIEASSGSTSAAPTIGTSTDEEEEDADSSARTTEEDSDTPQPVVDETVEAMMKSEAKKAAQREMAKALAQEGICLANIEISLKEVVVQLNKEGSPFFKVTISDASTQVGIFPDHTTKVAGYLGDLRGSTKTNDTGIPLWTLAHAVDVPTPTGDFAKDSASLNSAIIGSPRNPGSWYDIIYVEGGKFGSFNLNVYDPSMPNFPGYDMEVDASVGGLRIVVLFRIIDEIITYLTAFTSMLGVIGYLQAAKSTDEPEPKTKLNVQVSSPIIYVPRNTESREHLSITLGETTVSNRLDSIAGVNYDFMTVLIKGLALRAFVKNPEQTGMVQRSFIDGLDLGLNINRAIEGNEDHILPDVDISSNIDLIHIALAGADLSMLVGLLDGNFSEFVLRKDEIELKEAIAFLENINLVQFISNLVPISLVNNLNTIPFVKVRVAFNIAAVGATLYRGAGTLVDGGDSALLAAKVSTLEINVIVTSDDGIQLGLNVDRIEITDVSQGTNNKFRYVLLPSLGFAKTQVSSNSSAPPSPSPYGSTRLSRAGSVSSSVLGRSGLAYKPPPFFKLRYEDRPRESIEFVTVTLLHPRIFIVPDVVQELVGILLPVIGSLLTALDTWHQRLLFGSTAEQQVVVTNAISSLESRHRDELAQLVTQHRNELSSIRANKNSTPADEEAMIKHQERDRNALLESQRVQLRDLKQNGIVPKWTNPNEMRVKVEIESPEICILERSDTICSASFVISLGHVILRLSLLPDKISVEPNVCDFGVSKAILDSTDMTATLDKVLLLQPFDVNGSILVRPPTPRIPSQMVDILLNIGLFHTIVSYRDVRLGVEVFRSFEPMIDKILKLVEEVTKAEAEKEMTALLSGDAISVPPKDELVLQLNVKQMLFSLLNDHIPQFVVPVAKLTLDQVVALIQTGEYLNVTVNLPSISADGFNNALSAYEPIIEPWCLDLKVLEREQQMTIPISAEQRNLNINVTKSLFDAIFGIIAFVDDMKAILAPPPTDDKSKLAAGAILKSPYSQPRAVSHTGVIPSPTIPKASSSTSEEIPSTHHGHVHKPSATLSVHQIAALGQPPALASTYSSPSATPSTPGAISTPNSSSNTPTRQPSINSTGAERSFDPFLVRNDTNEVMRVWKSNEGIESGFIVSPGEQVSLRSQKASKHAAEATFFLNVEITIGSSILALERIPIEKVHTQVYSLHTDKNVKVLSEVTLQQGTKILTLSTVHYIKNATSENIDVQVVSAANAIVDLHIPSQQTRSIPLRYCSYQELRLRPSNGGFDWFVRKDKSSDSLMNCRSQDSSSNRSWSCVLSYTSRQLDGGKDYCLMLSPQLIFENLTASTLLLKTYTPQVKAFGSAIASIFTGSKNRKDIAMNPVDSEADTPNKELAFDIEVGDQLPVFAAQAADSVVDQYYRVQIPGYNWSDPIYMKELFAKQKAGFSFERALSITDVSGRTITLYALIFPPSVGSMRVSFFSKYWLINQTGLCLSYRPGPKAPPLKDDPRSINMTGNPRTWYKGDFMSERAAQKAYYSSGEIAMSILSQGDQSSPWSSSITLEQKEEDQVQQTKLETVTIADPVANRLYTFQMTITTAPGKHWRTKEVRISPAYILINKSSRTIYYKQFLNNRDMSNCFDLLPGERVPFHWSSTKTKGKRFLFTTKEALFAEKDPMASSWSVPFKLSVLDSFVCKLKTSPSNMPREDQLIQVQIIERQHVFCVVFRDSPQDTIPFYKIDNRTNADIFIEQKGIAGSLEKIPPRSLQNWYWENPLEDPSSRCAILKMADTNAKGLSEPYTVQLDRAVIPRDEREAREGRPTLPLQDWDLRLKGNPGAQVKVRLVQQGVLKILILEYPGSQRGTIQQRPRTTRRQEPPALSTLPLSTPTAITSNTDSSPDLFAKPELSIDVSIRLSGIGISLIDHFRGKTPSELVYVSLIGISANVLSCKKLHTLTLNVNKLQVDNQMKFAPEPVLITSVRAPLRGAKRTSDFAPLLMTTVEIDTSDESLVYVRQIALELQVLDVSVDQPFILAMAGYGEGLAKYIALQSGQEQSILTPETTLPNIGDEELISPNFFVQVIKIYPVSLVLTLSKGSRIDTSAQTAFTSNSETLIKRITDPILMIGSINRTTVQLGVFELQRVYASASDFGMRVAEHYRDQGIRNISKVIFNYLSIIKLFSSDPPPRAPIRLPRYFPPDFLVTPFDTAMAYGQNLLITMVNGKLASEIYLFHIWVGSSKRPTLVLATTKTMALIDDSGLRWEEKTDTFVGTLVDMPPAGAKNQYGSITLFFDAFEVSGKHEPAIQHKRKLDGLSVEQLIAVDRSVQSIGKTLRSTSHTTSIISKTMPSLDRSY
jgi:hypothetical protein